MFDTEASEYHHGECSRSYGPRGGEKTTIEVWRRNGMTRRWKRDTSRFEIPVKYGMYSYGTIDQNNCDQFHRADTCPLLQPSRKPIQCPECGLIPADQDRADVLWATCNRCNAPLHTQKKYISNAAASKRIRTYQPLKRLIGFTHFHIDHSTRGGLFCD